MIKRKQVHLSVTCLKLLVEGCGVCTWKQHPVRWAARTAVSGNFAVPRVRAGVQGDRGRCSKAFWDGDSGLVVVWAEVGTG